MNLSKQIIHKQVEEIAQNYFAAQNDTGKKFSCAFTVLAISKILDIDMDSAYEAVTDASNDMKIDGLYFEEPNEDMFKISLFQMKYSQNFDKDGGFKENDIIAIISTLRNLFGDISKFHLSLGLKTKIDEISSYIASGNIPIVTIYLVNNGKVWEANANKHIENFLNESPMNKEIFEFIYINHDDILAISTKDKKVNCMLNFNGKFIDEEFNFKRALIGTVPVKNIADIMEQHHSSILKQNVRDFLGSKGINQNIKETLEDRENRKNFYFLNNGITIVCSNVGYAPSTTQLSTIIKLSNAQIINGGQTSKSIQNVILDEKNKDEDFSQAAVLVRIYKVDEENLDDGELIDNITLATNSQNAVKLSDLRANDTIQKNIETGLKAYGMEYIRRRNDKRAKKGAIRKEIVAQIILAAILKKPNEAKYKKALHFGILYGEIFNEKNIRAELIILLARLFTMIETKRKTIDGIKQKEYPFVSYSSEYILMILFEKIQGLVNYDDILNSLKELEAQFDDYYIKSLDELKQRFVALGVDLSDSLEIITILKSSKLNGKIIK